MVIQSFILRSVRDHFNILAVGLILLLSHVPAHAGLIFTASGTGTSGHAISGTAEFDFVTHNFGSGSVNAIQITLSNTAAATTQRGNLITGLFWNIDGNAGSLSTTATGFNGLAASVYTNSSGATTSNVDISPAVKNTATDGTWQLSNGAFGTANSGGSYAAFEYGIATVGMGLNGFNGADVNGDDYGIFGGAVSGLSASSVSGALPLIKDSAKFWIPRPNSLTNLNQFGNVRITYGSLPDNFLTAVPEPTSLVMVGLTLVGMGGVRRRRSLMTKSTN